MNSLHIGLLHPGAMGISLAAALQRSGHRLYWASKNRSSDSRNRAEKHDLIELSTVEEICSRCSVIISVCPPHAASEVAEEVLEYSYKGIYVDANAISPQRVRSIGQKMVDGSIDFVDGGIIGPPAWQPETTWLYLSGKSGGKVVNCFTAGPLGVEWIGEEIGKVSALKMCFAANSKGTTALLAAIVATARKLGVREELEKQWSRHSSSFVEITHKRITKASLKAWRFSGEMEEIASTLEEAGLPGGFHLAASEVYRRLAGLKDGAQNLSVDDVLTSLLEPDGGER